MISELCERIPNVWESLGSLNAPSNFDSKFLTNTATFLLQQFYRHQPYILQAYSIVWEQLISSYTVSLAKFGHNILLVAVGTIWTKKSIVQFFRLKIKCSVLSLTHLHYLHTPYIVQKQSHL